MDITQAVLLSVITIVSIFLVVLGIQAFFVLRDFRKTLKKVDRVLVDADQIADDIKRPVETVSNLITTVSGGAGIVHLLSKDKKGKSDNPHLNSFITGLLLVDTLTQLLGVKAAQKIKEEILKEGTNLLEGVVERLEEVEEKVLDKAQDVKEKIVENAQSIKEEITEVAPTLPKQIEQIQKKSRRFFFSKKPARES